MIKHAGIVVTDIKKAIKFYELLGFKKVMQRRMKNKFISELLGFWEDTDQIDLTYVKMKKGKGAMLELYLFNGNEKEFVTVSGFNHISIEVYNIDELYKKFADMPEIDVWIKPKIVKRVYKIMFCRDRDCNLLELIETL